VENWLGIDGDLPAFCVPINIANRRRAVVHMSRTADLPWDDESRQLAQAFINTAVAALVSLDLLEEAEKRSLTDGLTGLYNRRSMEAMLRREVMLAQRHGQSLALVMIDIDHFKPINDRHGHASGDFILRTLADCLRATLRRTDLAFRYGGDEFVVALPQTSIMQAQQVVQKLRQSFASADFSAGIAHLEVRPTLSVGVAAIDEDSGLRSLPQLLEAADAAMYQAKSESRNAVRVYRRAA
jgi:diguanylate cyclase (GGDEF)-like protein